MNIITETLDAVNYLAENLRSENEEKYLNILSELRNIIKGYNILADKPLLLQPVMVVKENKNTIYAPFYTYRLA